MWISKRKFQELEKRIADLEMAVRSQQKEITSLNYPYEDVKQAFAEVLLPWRSLGYIHIPARDQTAGHGNSNETVSPGNGQAEENIQEKRTDALLDPEH